MSAEKPLRESIVDHVVYLVSCVDFGPDEVVWWCPTHVSLTRDGGLWHVHLRGGAIGTNLSIRDAIELACSIEDERHHVGEFLEGGRCSGNDPTDPEVMSHAACILLLMIFGLLHAWLIGSRWLAFLLLLLFAFFFLSPVSVDFSRLKETHDCT